MKNEDYTITYYCKYGRQYTKHLVVPFSRYIRFPSSLMSHLLICEKCGHSQTISQKEHEKYELMKEKVDRAHLYRIMNKKYQAACQL